MKTRLSTIGKWLALALCLFPLIGWDSQKLHLEWLWQVGAAIGVLSLIGMGSIVSPQLKSIKTVIVGLILFSVLGSIMAAANRSAALEGWLSWGWFVVGFVVLRHWFSDRNLRLAAVKLLAAMGVGTAFYGFWLFTSDGVRDAWIVAQFGWHNVLAAFLMPTVLITIALFLTSVSLRKWLWGSFAVLAIVVFVLTYSRAAWLCLAVGLVLAAVFWARQLGAKQVALSLGLIMAISLMLVKLVTQSPGLALIPTAQHNRSEAVVDMEGSSVSGRLHYWEGAFNLWVQHPLVGVGLGSFGDFLPQVQTDVRFFSYFAHNFYLQTLAEGGLIAAVVLLLLFWVLGKEVVGLSRTHWRKVDHAGQLEKTVRIGLLGAVAAMFLHAGLDFDLAIPAIMATLVIVLALLFPASPRATAAVPQGRQKWIAMGAVLVVIILSSSLAAADWLASQGLDQFTSSDLTSSQSSFSAASVLNPLEPSYRLRLAEIAYGNQDINSALQLTQQTTALNPQFNYVYALHADLAAASGNYSQAITDYQQALRLDPWNRPQFYANLAVLYVMQGNDPTAITLLETFSTKYTLAAMQSDMPSRDIVKPDVVKAYELLSQLYTRHGQADKANRVDMLLAELNKP